VHPVATEASRLGEAKQLLVMAPSSPHRPIFFLDQQEQLDEIKHLWFPDKQKWLF
jgi:hypothetical protein